MFFICFSFERIGRFCRTYWFVLDIVGWFLLMLRYSIFDLVWIGSVFGDGG